MDPSLDLFDRLDHYWKNRSGENIEAILNIAEDRSDPTDVRVDLCAADLEWRLRTGTESITKSSRRAVTHLSAIPRAVDYQRLLGPIWESSEVQKQMLEAEWVARSRFGDRPDVDEFAIQMPCGSAWRDELASLLDLIAPLRLSFHNHEEVVMSCPVPAKFVIGRANRDEPGAPAWNEKENRAIVANAQFRSLSRAQVSLRRVRVEEVEVVNLSGLIPCKLDFGTLKPGETARRSLPLTLFFTHYRLQICCVSDIEFSLENDEP